MMSERLEVKHDFRRLMMVPLVAGPHHDCARQDKWHTLSRHAQCVMGQFVPLAWRIGLRYRRRKYKKVLVLPSGWQQAKSGASFADATARPENGSKQGVRLLEDRLDPRGNRLRKQVFLEPLESQILIPQIQPVTAPELAGISEHGASGPV
jgi:hypothetical protein